MYPNQNYESETGLAPGVGFPRSGESRYFFLHLYLKVVYCRQSGYPEVEGRKSLCPDSSGFFISGQKFESISLDLVPSFIKLIL